MKGKELITLATEYCIHFHKGQTRKGNGEPYHTHPIAVAQILKNYGYTDPVQIAIALLHDAVEDSDTNITEIKKLFDYQVGNGVYMLSRNTIMPETIEHIALLEEVNPDTLTINEVYKKRLLFARKKIQLIRGADTIHNTYDLESLSTQGIYKKIYDSETFYIPLLQKIDPRMALQLEGNIRRYYTSIMNQINIETFKTAVYTRRTA